MNLIIKLFTKMFSKGARCQGSLSFVRPSGLSGVGEDVIFSCKKKRYVLCRRGWGEE